MATASRFPARPVVAATCAIVLFLAFAAVVSTAETQRIAVPSAGGQAKVLDTVAEIYELDKNRSDDEKRALAEELLSSAEESGTKPIDRFVLLRTAAQLASEAGDAVLTLETVDQMGAAFQIDPLVTQGKLLRTIAAKAKTPKRLESLLEASNRYIDAAVAKQRFDYAASVALMTYRTTQQIHGKDFRKDALDRYREVQQLQEEQKQLQEALQAVAANPDDPEANLAVGRILCFTHGAWSRGLPYVVKGSDVELASAARLEQTAPSDPREQVKLGDAWWAAAEKAEGRRQATLKLHAGEWYAKASPNLSGGLAKVKADKRLAELAKIKDPNEKKPASRLTSTLKKGLVLHYPFDKDDGQRVTDKSESANHGTPHGTKWMAAARGPKNAAMGFNGETSFIDAGATESLKMAEQVTVAMWFMPVAVGKSAGAVEGYRNLLSDHGRGGNNGKILRMQNNRIEYMMGPEGSSDVGVDLPAINKWYHAVVTYDGNAMRLYMNGKPLVAQPNTGPVPVNPNPILIGKSGFQEFFRGLIDDVMLYNRALTAKEVAQLYKAQGGK